MGGKRIVASSEEMVALGKQIGAALRPNTIVTLSGNLGAGKTTLAQGIALGLGIETPISSPTFVFLNSYQGSLPLFHFDLYRMKDESDFLGLGFDEYFVQGGICLIEWPERILPILPAGTLHISLSHAPKGRIATLPDELVESAHCLCN